MSRLMKQLIWISLLSLIGLNACRAPSGPHDYDSQEVLPEPIDPIIEDLADGERRLSIGIFYEGPRTDEVEIDDLNAFFYIYEETFSLVKHDDELVEGVSSDLITLSGGPWWGGGVHWQSPRSLTDYKTLKVSLKSSEGTFESLEIGMNNSDLEQVKLKAADYGFSTDGEWHSLFIPLSDFTDQGLDLEQVLAPLVLIGNRGAGGERILVDAVYFTTNEI